MMLVFVVRFRPAGASSWSARLILFVGVVVAKVGALLGVPAVLMVTPVISLLLLRSWVVAGSGTIIVELCILVRRPVVGVVIRILLGKITAIILVTSSDRERVTCVKHRRVRLSRRRMPLWVLVQRRIASSRGVVACTLVFITFVLGLGTSLPMPLFWCLMSNLLKIIRMF
jgi:hypothetical protein